MKTPKLLLAGAIILGGLLALGPAMVRADDKTNQKTEEKKDEKKEDPKPTPTGKVRKGARGAIDAHLKEVADELKLTDEQKEKIKPILQEEADKIRELRGDDKGSKKDKVHKLREIQEAISAKVKPILQEDQLAKWDKIKGNPMGKLRKKKN